MTNHLVQARRHFTRAAQAEEARHDADTFAAVCDAIMVFSRHDSNAIADAADRIENLLDRREARILRTHQPAWLQPRRSAETAGTSSSCNCVAPPTPSTRMPGWTAGRPWPPSSPPTGPAAPSGR